ncbi:hypothetical protein PSP6_470074 [Paraburkholderia tropica]|nr:hypothetical protein PSP6_470074 [Paraburkholderia tropica]
MPRRKVQNTARPHPSMTLRARGGGGWGKLSGNKSHDGTVLPFLCLATVSPRALPACGGPAADHAHGRDAKFRAQDRSSVPRERRQAA